MQKQKDNNAGFTLVEIMIVISILGLLIALVIPSIIKARETAQLNSIFNNLRIIENAKDQWALEQKRGEGDITDWAALSDYLKGGTVKPVALETYTPSPIGSRPYAISTVKLGSYTAGDQITTQ